MKKKKNLLFFEINSKLENPNIKTNLENLSAQKNQLEIEKKEKEKKYEKLIEEHISKFTKILTSKK